MSNSTTADTESARDAFIQWQSGVPVTIHPDDLALAKPIWPKK
jgi:branched-chain amino acid transport system substrate-binding protein